LINRSNYCYINSILQALLACPPVYNLLTGLSEQNTSKEKQNATPIIDGMCRFVKEFQHLPAGLRVRRHDKNQKKDQGVSIDYDLPFEPSWMYKVLNGIRSDSFLVEGRQEDAEEFLGCLLNGLNDEMLELMKLVKSDLASNKFDTKSNDEEADKEWQVMGPKNKGGITRQIEFVKTPISNIFGGFLKSRIHRAGDHSTYNIQPFFTLQLNSEKVKTVREALEALVSKNQLEGVTSEKTNEEVEAWQQVTLEELPVILILHLKCFDFKLNGCTKIVKALEFPIDLKIDSKLLSSKPNTPKEKQYKLFAVVYHDGKEATKGHYITDAFHVGYSSWIRYDDASVRTVQEDYVLKPQGTRVPYLLFYRRSDTIRSK
jgi:ubiquitin carboxyl-terminal hydrolase 10